MLFLKKVYSWAQEYHQKMPNHIFWFVHESHLPSTVIKLSKQEHFQYMC
jgi:hypothetical protein